MVLLKFVCVVCFLCSSLLLWNSGWVRFSFSDYVLVLVENRLLWLKVCDLVLLDRVICGSIVVVVMLIWVEVVCNVVEVVWMFGCWFISWVGRFIGMFFGSFIVLSVSGVVFSCVGVVLR